MNRTKIFIVSTMLLVMALASCKGSKSQTKKLTIASWLPPSHSVNKVFWPKFIEEIEARTDGRVTAHIEYDLATPDGMLELVEYGGADFAWTYNGYFPGRFVTTKLIELPGYHGNSRAAAVAHWRAHQKYLKDAQEYAGVELIGFMVHRSAFLFLTAEIDHLNQVEGLKMRSGGGVASEVVNRLNASAILAPASKAYEMISGGAADGTLLPADVIPTFRLYEVTPYMYSLPGGFYRGSFSLFMNEDSLKGVSEEDQKAIREYFGELLSADAGQAWDIDHERGISVQKEKGQVFDLNQENIQYFAEITKDIRKSVIEEVNAKGLDGQAAYDLIAETMDNYER